MKQIITYVLDDDELKEIKEINKEISALIKLIDKVLKNIINFELKEELFAVQEELSLKLKERDKIWDPIINPLQKKSQELCGQIGHQWDVDYEGWDICTNCGITEWR